MLGFQDFSTLLHSLGLIQGLKPLIVANLTVSAVDSDLGPINMSLSASTPNDSPLNMYEYQDVELLSPLSSTHWLAAAVNVSCEVLPWKPLGTLSTSFPPWDPAVANLYRYRKQQSVNLGSWFVHEQWMTPSLFLCASGPQIAEIDIASGWGNTSNARAILERHWDTFISQSDFDYLASIGINTVRLPIGYWSLGSSYCEGTPFNDVADVYTNAWARVVRAINMAANAGIGVLVDLHGAVGSQNGQPHSGISDGLTQLFDHPDNIEKTLSVLTFLVQELSMVTNVVGVELLNEPDDDPKLEDFYTNALDSLRLLSTAAQSFPFYVHDAFNLPEITSYLTNRTDFVVEDHHSYFVYTAADNVESADDHTHDIGTTVYGSLQDASMQLHRNFVVEEWSSALTPESLSQEADPTEAQKTFGIMQMQVYTNTTAGWGFWAYRKEDCDVGWCFQAAVNQTLPSTFFSYGKMTGVSETLETSIMNIAAPSNEQILSIFSNITSTSTSPPAVSFPANVDSVNPAAWMNLEKDDSTTSATMTGFTHGFLTAQIFALNNMSKLGFVHQYINDTLGVMGAGTEDAFAKSYRVSFVTGLMYAENLVNDVIPLY